MTYHRTFRTVSLSAAIILWMAALFGACTDDGNTSNSSGSGGGGGGDDCTVNGQICAVSCDPNLGCVACITSADCGAANPICVAGECEECGDSADCPTGQSCFPENHECSDSCTDSSGCMQDDAPICDPLSGACVGCMSDADCTGPNTEGPICSAVTQQCVECANNNDCGAAKPICDVEDGTCEECLLDAQCDLGQVCNDKDCVAGCSSNADCSDDGKPLCDVGASTCVECLSASDCPTAQPVCQEGECVVCASNEDCTDLELPYCDEGDACVECLDDEHCGSGFACDNQQCVAAG